MLGNQLTDNQPKPLPTTVLQTPPLGPFQTANMTSLPDLESERDTLSRFLITLAQQWAPGHVSEPAPRLTSRCGRAILSQGSASLSFKKWGRLLHAHPHLSSHCCEVTTQPQDGRSLSSQVGAQSELSLRRTPTSNC